MTYSLFQNGKCIGPLATITGYGELIDYVQKKQNTAPDLNAAISSGTIKDRDKVRKEILNILVTSPSKDIFQTLRSMYNILGLTESNDPIVIGDS